MSNLFPSIVPFNVQPSLARRLNERIYTHGYKNVQEAKVYDIDGAKEVVNLETRFNSWKNEFDDEKIRNILTQHVFPIIEEKLNARYKDKLFYLSLGNQKLDYIFYRNGGFFTVHHDFVALQTEGMCQYTCLIGLTDDPKCIGGNTTIYTPITNQEKFIEIVKSNPKCKLFHSSGDPIGIPHQYNCFNQGNCLMFKSELYHAGEPFNGFKKELLMFTINVTGVEIDKHDEINGKFLVQTRDNKAYLVPQSYLSDTLFSNMSSFYNSHQLNSEMLSHEFEALLKFINVGKYSDDPDIDARIQSYVYIDYRFYECKIPKVHHKKLHDWLNSAESCIKFDKFEPFMTKFAKEYNLIPFQVILCESSVNRSSTKHTLIRYFNFDENLDTCSNINILNCMQVMLNKIYEQLRTSYEYDRIENKKHTVKYTSCNKGLLNNKLSFDYVHIESENKHKIGIAINEFSSTFNFDDDFVFSKKENISGQVLETEWCNDGSYHYYAKTTMYFSCKVDVKYCFCKNNI